MLIIWAHLIVLFIRIAMAFAKGRNDVQVGIEHEYTTIKWFIHEVDSLFKSELSSTEARMESELEAIDEPDPDIRLSMCRAITQDYSYSYIYEELILSSKRTLLIAIFTYFESILKRISKLYEITVVDKEGKVVKEPRVTQILSAIEKEKGELPVEANSLKNKVPNDLRLLRNYCVHEGTIDEKTEAIIKEDPNLDREGSELYIKDKQVLLDYLEATKAFLVILEEHCRRNSSRP